MKKIVKITFINFLIFLLMLEGLSFIAIQLNLFKNPSIPSYGFGSSFYDTDWRNERHLWGAWHKNNSISLTKRSCFNVEYRSNNIGARDDIDYTNLKTKKDTILLLGDSFAEGYGVNVENSFAKIIENNSNKQVLNLGSAGSFGPLQEYLIYKNLGSSFRFDEIILFFLPENDFTDNSSVYQDSLFKNRYRPYFDVGSKNFEIYYPANSKPSDNFPSASAPSSIIIKKILIDFFYSANLLREAKIILLNNIDNTLSTKNTSGYFFDEKPSIDGTLYYIEKILSETPENIKKTIIIIPTEKDLRMIRISGLEYKSLYWYKNLAKLGGEYDINMIDLALKSDIFSFELINNGINEWFLPCDGHWSKNGNIYAAETYMNHQSN